MSEFGVGPQDWLELDLDYVDRERRDRVLDLLDAHRQGVERVVGGPFEVLADDDGPVTLVVEQQPVASAERTVTDRLLVTRYQPEDGPL